MKHFISTTLLLLAMLLPALASAHDFEVDGIYYKINGSRATVTYKGTSYYSYSDEYTGNVTIPASVTYNGTTYSVTSIGYAAFEDCSGLTSVSIPNTVTSINYDAFRGCNSLTSVAIPNSVTSIGSSAFHSCSGLTSVTIPNSVTTIGDYAFYYCSGLTSIVVADGNPKYDSRDNCNAIIETASNTLMVGCQSTTIPNSVTSIGDAAFYGCSDLTSVTIPNSVTSIEDAAFSGCSGLTTIQVANGNPKYDSRNNCNAIIETASNTLIAGCQSTIIPNSVTYIGDYAFLGCSGLTSVTIPNSVSSIGDEAFCQCSGLTSVTIGNSVTSIGNLAFFFCGLLSIDIPNSVTSVGNYAFYGCSYMTSVTIGNSVTSIGSSAFSDCSVLTSVTIGNSVTSIGSYAFYGCSYLTNVTIPNSVTSIGSSAFSDCSGLTSVTIGSSVASIGDRAFSDCSLTSVTCLATTPPVISDYTFSNYFNVTLIIPKNTKSLYQAADNWKSFSTISEIQYDFEISGIYYAITGPNTVSVTNKYTDHRSYWSSVIIPSNVTNNGTTYQVTAISDNAFSNCIGLTSVSIPNSVSSIGKSTFSSCKRLTNVAIPNSITSIGNYAFEGCGSLSSVHITDVAAWCNISFQNSYSNPLSIAHHLYLNGEEVTDLVIPNSVTSIGIYAFEGSSSLTSVTIPNSVTSIGNSAFSGCSLLETIYFNAVSCADFSSNESSNPFYNTNVSIIKIGNNVKKIPAYFAKGLSKLNKVTIGNSVISIGKDAFAECNGLTSITVASNNPTYDSRENCNAIVETATNTMIIGCKNTIIPSSVTSIGNSAFAYCSGLINVTIPNTVTTIGNSAFAECI